MQVSLLLLVSGFHLVFFCTDLRKLELILLFVSFLVQYMKSTVSTTMRTISVTRAATQRSVVGMAWTVQKRFRKTLLMVSWFW